MPSNHSSAELEAMARKILLHSRRRITHLSPILLESIYALPERVRSSPGPLSTDGCALWFDPQQVVEDFRADRDSIARQILHVTLHCLLGHLELRPSFEKTTAFDWSADLKAAQLAEGLCGYAFATTDGSRLGSLDDCPHLRPLYDALVQDPHQRSYLHRAAKSARFDDHALWTPPTPPSVQGAGGSSSNGNGPPNWAQIRQSMLDGTGGKLPGSCAGMLTENFSVPDRGMSFAEFLRRFASPEERMLLDPDSFDPRWYHLGMEYYGDIPLLEPSELSEPPLPDDLVIALDTSGSCSGEVCKRFLKETLGILRDISSGVSRFRVLLLQCDTKIQQQVMLESPEQVEDLFRSFTAHGFGGTDFRPVFQRVDELRQNGTLPRVRGLLYLSDGWGEFPNHPTDYPTAFLIPAEEQNSWHGDADWITRLYLNETDFTVKEANS